MQRIIKVTQNEICEIIAHFFHAYACEVNLEIDKNSTEFNIRATIEQKHINLLVEAEDESSV